MAKTQERKQELDHLYAWCRTLLAQFKLVTPPSLAPLLEPFGVIVENSYRKDDLPGLRQIAKDLLESAGGLTSEQQRELDDRLKSEVGRGLEKPERAARTEKTVIARVLKRGHIESTEEYRVSLERVEEVWNDDSKRDEVEALNAMLAAFHSKDAS
ncbi:MAG TPA: hypothetical protein VM686_43060 [Polyangiaceae bacterium]|nr:hypothetical protein [Polyangiaceae bacterium]